MVMPRQPLLPVIVPSRNRLPLAGAGLWYPLHGTFESRIADVQDAAEVVIAGSANADKWTEGPGFYTFPDDNGDTNDVVIRAAHLDDDTDYLNDVLGLESAALDTQIIVACEGSFVEQADASGALWSYGVQTSASCYGIQVSSTEKVQLHWRGYDASTVSQVGTGTIDFTGVDFTAVKGQGRFVLASSIKVTGALTVLWEAVLAHSSLGTSNTISYEMDFGANSGTARAGRGAQTAAQHLGLHIGARATASAADLYFGKGATNTGRIGNFCARRFSTYDATRLAAVAADMLARPRSFPRTLLN